MSKKGKNAQFELAKVTAKRDLYFAEIEELFHLSKSIHTPDGASAFLTRFLGFDDLRERFTKMVEIWNDMNFQANPEYKPDYEMLRLAERHRCVILAAAKDLKREEPRPASSSSSVKLPKITVPEFDGDLSQWPTFFEKFDSLVHRNNSLDDLARMHYLMEALKGKARDVCVGLTPIAANYPILLDALKSRYDNKRTLASHFLEQLFDLRPLASESAASLSQVLVRFDTAFKSLQNLRLPDLLDFLITQLLLSKLDPTTRRVFETSAHPQIPTYRETYNFLLHHVEALGQVPGVRNTRSKPSAAPRSNLPALCWKPLVNQVGVATGKSDKGESDRLRSCPLCNNAHQIYRCAAFLKLTPEDRLRRVQQNHWCPNCLSNSHTATSCNSKGTCRTCHQAHHTLLHPTSSSLPALPSGSPPPDTDKPPCNLLTSFQVIEENHRDKGRVPILPTAIVGIQTPFGLQFARFLIDSGSQRHFISHACCRKLNLPLRRENIPLEGMGNVRLQAIGSTDLVITSRQDTAVQYKISALVTERITRHLPPHPVRLTTLQYLQDLPLADPDFFRPGRIDGILGIQLFGRILAGPAVAGPNRSTFAVPTSLGHIVMGEAPKVKPTSSFERQPVSTFCILDCQELHRAVQRFWELEEVPRNPKLSAEEKACEEIYKTTTTRIAGQRYCVKLPFREDPPRLGDSFRVAEKRFYNLERRFKRDPEFHAQYSAVLQDYLSQGHLAPAPPATSSDEPACFIPHFAVLKDSSSTPLRIVFDASARTANGRSLNDTLFTGPKLQKDISEILLSFRISAVALVADIRQMYRNIAVHPEHRRFQRILWRNSPREPLQAWELNCVMFGLTSAPFLALRTVQQLATDEHHQFPIAAPIAKSYMYVDDLVISRESVPAALEAYHQLVGLFRAGGFTLTKWVSNSTQVLQAIPAEDRLKSTLDFSNASNTHEITHVLGLTWDYRADSFLFKFHAFQPTFTKRGILSIVARIWDPLGFLAPVTLEAKLVIKELWTRNIGWDDDLPLDIRSRWQSFLDGLSSLQSLRVPRYFGEALNSSVALIGFADASEKGYGAAVYIRLPSKTPAVHLLIAKSRVAPQKAITLPRLELCAAVLLAKLISICNETLAQHFANISHVALTDSSVTLAWIKNDSQKRDIFVANRISVIQDHIPAESWFHIPSQHNVADWISRGLSPGQLVDRPDWIYGPAWLQLEQETWPIQATIPASAIDFVVATQPPTAITTCIGIVSDSEGIEPFLCRFSSWKRLLRVFIYMLRFCKRLPIKPSIELADMETAERILIRQVQQEHFPADVRLLQKKTSPSTTLRPLLPFLDGEIIRVGGRLSNSDLPYESKHPILLPKRSHLSTLIIKDCHQSNFHTGPTLIIAVVRQRFWILSLRSLARKCVRECNLCFRRHPRPHYPLMADLPTARVQEAKPFLNTGVDYAGPFQISISRRRGTRSQKAYLCLFICLATKAIHLELASSLSTETFLACFKRFIARRGPVQCLYSDRGTNFIGAKAELDKIHDFLQSEAFLHPITNLLEDRRITWKFNPPSSPHFGGIWEANIRSVKTHLTKVIGSQILSYEELYTVLVQIEALLNSRPLCPSTSDPADADALTPAHFLTYTPLRSLPLSDRVPTLPHHTRKSLLDSMVRSFWDRWRRDYLSSLQHRSKWNSPVPPLKVGMVVVVKSDSTPPLQWPLALVEEVHPGPDGVVRVATVRIGRNSFQRPTAKLCPLPTQ